MDRAASCTVIPASLWSVSRTLNVSTTDVGPMTQRSVQVTLGILHFVEPKLHTSICCGFVVAYNNISTTNRICGVWALTTTDIGLHLFSRELSLIRPRSRPLLLILLFVVVLALVGGDLFKNY